MEKVGQWLKALARIFSTLDNSWESITVEVRRVVPQRVEVVDQAEDEYEDEDEVTPPTPDASERLHQPGQPS